MNRTYSYEEVVGSYNRAVNDYKNQLQRVPGRAYSAKAVEEYAVKLHKEKYKDALHPYVIDQFRAK